MKKKKILKWSMVVIYLQITTDLTCASARNREFFSSYFILFFIYKITLICLSFVFFLYDMRNELMTQKRAKRHVMIDLLCQVIIF